MTLWHDSEDFRLYVGDVRDELDAIADESVDCVVTSPPYYGLRDYGFDRQIGLEDTPDDYVAEMVGVFRQIRRVLAPHGTVWLNIGDTYNNRSVGRQSSHQGGLGFESDDLAKSWAELTGEGRTRLSIDDGELKEKDLIGVPWMLAFALRAGWSRCVGCNLELRTDLWPRWDGGRGGRVCIDCLAEGRGSDIVRTEPGWWLRAGIVWGKPNGMPEAVSDRPTRSHEFVFLLAKSERYFYDQDAVREPFASTRGSGNVERKHGADVAAPGARPGDLGRSIPWSPAAEPDPDVLTLDGSTPPAETPDGRKVTSIQAGADSIQHRDGERWPNPAGRNMRDVWTIPPKPFKGAHFAVMPEEVARRAILAGSPEQVCRICGTPRRRVTVSHATGSQRARSAGGLGKAASREPHGLEPVDGTFRENVVSETIGWTICGCLPDGTELFERDALELVDTPLGHGTGRTGIDPTPETGRRGLGRPRADDEGVRPITRYEQRRYAAQLKASPHRAEMEADAGDAFAHYVRTDRAGARPVPPDLLDRWVTAGWLTVVDPPDVAAADWPGKWRPGVVLDPFMGSGTTAKVARDHGRHAVGVEANAGYAQMCIDRNAQMTIFVEEGAA